MFVHEPTTARRIDADDGAMTTARYTCATGPDRHVYDTIRYDIMPRPGTSTGSGTIRPSRAAYRILTTGRSRVTQLAAQVAASFTSHTLYMRSSQGGPWPGIGGYAHSHYRARHIDLASASARSTRKIHAVSLVGYGGFACRCNHPCFLRPPSSRKSVRRSVCAVKRVQLFSLVSANRSSLRSTRSSLLEPSSLRKLIAAVA